MVLCLCGIFMHPNKVSFIFIWIYSAIEVPWQSHYWCPKERKQGVTEIGVLVGNPEIPTRYIFFSLHSYLSLHFSSGAWLRILSLLINGFRASQIRADTNLFWEGLQSWWDAGGTGDSSVVLEHKGWKRKSFWRDMEEDRENMTLHAEKNQPNEFKIK